MKPTFNLSNSPLRAVKPFDYKGTVGNPQVGCCNNDMDNSPGLPGNFGPELIDRVVIDQLYQAKKREKGNQALADLLSNCLSLKEKEENPAQNLSNMNNLDKLLTGLAIELEAVSL